jgi:abortive infection bacteriophage resistance protein
MTYEQQIQKLKGKSLVISNEESAKATLRRYGYFALITGYKDLLKNRTTKNYQDGTTFEDIVAIYQFDEQLRELTLRYLLHIERHIRSALSYGFCMVYGENQREYLNRDNYDISSPYKEKEVTKLINKYLSPLIMRRTQYAYIEHHKSKHQNVPLWVLVNALTFGTLSKMYEYSKPQVQSAVSIEFEGISEQQLKQLLEVLTDFRNVCAHNERLFTYRCAKHDIPDLPLHKKLSILQNGQQYVYGKRFRPARTRRRFSMPCFRRSRIRRSRSQTLPRAGPQNPLGPSLPQSPKRKTKRQRCAVQVPDPPGV